MLRIYASQSPFSIIWKLSSAPTPKNSNCTVECTIPQRPIYTICHCGFEMFRVHIEVTICLSRLYMRKHEEHPFEDPDQPSSFIVVFIALALFCTFTVSPFRYLIGSGQVLSFVICQSCNCFVDVSLVLFSFAIPYLCFKFDMAVNSS